MRFNWIRFCITIITLLLVADVNANGSDSIFIRYRASEKFGFGDFVWEKSTTFYLAQKKTGIAMSETPANIMRKLRAGWDIIRYDSTKDARQLRQSYLTVVPASNVWKFSDEIHNLVSGDILPANQLVRVGYLKSSLNAIFSISGIKVKSVYSDYSCSDILINDSPALLELARDKNVISFSLAGKIPHTEQALQRIDFSTNSITVAQNEMAAITGKGTIVSLKENLFDTADIDFKNRFFSSNYSPTLFDNHASIMATMLGGSGNSYYTGKGAAWQTIITPASFANLMPEPLEYYTSNNVGVQNHSYGTGIENEYAEDAAAYDLTTWEDTSLLHVFSAGNSGLSTSGNGMYKGIAGWANITGSFKMSKNSISVGGTDSFFQVQALSSRGPAFDGRIKPELVAFGEDGTSGAAALVTGSALLLQQKVAEQLSAKPSAALVKALLINGADDLGEDGPDFVNGYGNLNILQSLQIAAAKNYYTGILKNGGESNYQITVPANVKQLKVTLVWTDTPATALSSSALMNDLDIELRNQQTNATWYPWIRSSVANKDSLQLPAIRGVDRLNTVEMISIKYPSAGDYNIIVKPFQMVSQRQPFAVVYRWQIEDSALITFPTKADPIFAGEARQIVRWQSSFGDNSRGRLEVKMTNESTWKLLTDTLPMKQLWYQWKVPDMVAKAQLRIGVGNKIFTSDTFIISRPFNTQVGFACNDSVLIYWQKEQAAQQYKIYNLRDTLMQPLAITADTFYTINKTRLDNNFLAISGIIDGQETTRSYTIDFETQGVGCYIKNFLADLVGSTAELQLTLGSEFNVKNITVEKQVNGVFIAKEIIVPSQASSYSYTDDSLQQGNNSYRVRIQLLDGRIIYSQIETIFYTGDKLYLLYPNPVNRQQNLFVINHFTDGNLFTTLYDATGRMIKKYSLTQPVNEVYIKDIPAGVYLMLFNDGSKKLGVEKLVVW